MSSTRVSGFIIAAIASFAVANVSAEDLPQMRPAMIGSGQGSLVNLIDTQTLFQKGQRDAWVMFDCGVAGDGLAFGTDLFTSSPNAKLLENEIRRRLRQTRFIPAVNNHKRTSAWFAGTAVFVVAQGQPHLRIYANQDLDEIKRGADFVAPQWIEVPNHGIDDWPHFPSKATHDEVAGVVKLRHSVDANGKTTNVQVISEPPGYQLGDYLKKVVPLFNFLPGYRNGRPTATTYTSTFWFGRPVGR
jgi:Gram-negative bacterial TonB protein C-terminal